jgi:hypothetical protein
MQYLSEYLYHASCTQASVQEMLPTGQYVLGLGQLANKVHLIYVTLIHLGKHGQK